MSKLGNLAMTYYTNGFGADNVYAQNRSCTARRAAAGEQYRLRRKYPKSQSAPCSRSWLFQKNNEPHPNASYAFYRHILGNAAAKYGMKMLFTDFLYARG